MPFPLLPVLGGAAAGLAVGELARPKAPGRAHFEVIDEQEPAQKECQPEEEVRARVRDARG